MNLKPPYSQYEANIIAKNYQFLVGKKILDGDIHLATIEEVCIAPYENNYYEKFTNEFSLDINIDMEEVFYDDYNTPICDVVVFFSVTESFQVLGEWAKLRLTGFLQWKSIFLLSQDSL